MTLWLCVPVWVCLVGVSEQWVEGDARLIIHIQADLCAVSSQQRMKSAMCAPLALTFVNLKTFLCESACGAGFDLSLVSCSVLQPCHQLSAHMSLKQCQNNE